MPALLFPSLDALRLAVVSSLVPPEVARSPARFGVDAHGRAWLETDGLPRDALFALSRLGVQVLGSPGAATHTVRCWAEVLPLRRAAPPPGGLTLFQVPDRRLASFVAQLRRLHKAPVGVALLPEPHAGRAWVTAHSPRALPLLTDDSDADVRVYWQQAAGVWVARGWEHLLAPHLVVPGGGALLCDPDCNVTAFDTRPPEARQDDFPLPRRAAPAPAPAEPPRVDVRFRLKREEAPGEECLWVIGPRDEAGFRAFCRGADERLLARFEVAALGAGGESRLVVRREVADPAPQPAVGRGYQPDPRLPWLFVPAGYSLRPVVRANELAREFSQGAARLVWLEPAEGGVAVNAVAEAAFRPLSQQIDYAAPQRVLLSSAPPPGDAFPFERFALQVETTIDLEPEPAEAPAEAPPAAGEGEPWWVSKSVTRVLHWVRSQHRRARRDAREPGGGQPPEPGKRPAAADRQADRVEQKLASADALLHGYDWSSRRRELEASLLRDVPRLSPERRSSRWAELAGVYAATGQWQDAAVCWTNAIWDCANPPQGWLEQWASAECRAAKRSDRAGDLERWLGEPGRPGAGRVVAALAALNGSQPAPSPQFAAVLPRVLAILEQQFDDIPVRAAWLARLAVARSCDGDALGVARWRDRLIRRLHDRGPGLDLDEPSFLRFRGTASAERFQTAREWLARVRDPAVAWVKGHGDGGMLEWVGLSPETAATAEYAQMMFAWGLGVLGERARSRDWSARARKALARPAVAGADPAGHAFLGDLFLHRIKEAHEGHAPKAALPAELQARHERLPYIARYSVDRLRDHSRILQPMGQARAYRGLDVKEFWGGGELGNQLAVLSAHTDPALVKQDARALLAAAAGAPGTGNVPRIAFTLLEVAPLLEAAQLDVLLDLVPTALDWTEAWVRAGRWPEVERAGRVARFRARMLETAFAVAPAPAADRLMRHLLRAAPTSDLIPAVVAAAPRVFRAARRHELGAAAEALIELLDPDRGAWAERSLTPERVGLAIGWFVAGYEATGNRIVDAARDALYLAKADNLRQRTALALAYAEALGFTAASISLGRLEEIFQRLDRVAVHGSSNRYFTLQPLQLIDVVVRSVVTDDFTLGPAVRAWLDEDEFLIRRRIHRDMAALLRETALE